MQVQVKFQEIRGHGGGDYGGDGDGDGGGGGGDGGEDGDEAEGQGKVSHYHHCHEGSVARSMKVEPA